MAEKIAELEPGSVTLTAQEATVIEEAITAMAILIVMQLATLMSPSEGGIKRLGEEMKRAELAGRKAHYILESAKA